MFCSECGAQNTADSLRCTSCGAALKGAAGPNVLSSLGKSSALKGVFVLIVSFFTMPARTVRIAGRMLRDVGARGAFDTESSDVPHLTWLQTSGVVLTVLAMIGSALFALGMAVSALSDIGDDAASALGSFVLYLVGGALGVVAVNWVMMWGIEILGLAINNSNNLKKIASRS